MQKKAIVKIITLNREDMFILGRVNKKDSDVFYYNKEFPENVPFFRFIGAGDCVEITYTSEEKKPKIITNIQKWRVNDMRNKIIKILKEAMELSDKTRKDYVAICNKYSLTREGKNEQRQKAINKIAGEMARKTEEGLKLFDKRIEDISQEEQKELDRKNASLEYQQMITEKATVLEMISDLEEVPYEYLRRYLQEFENDPVAILAMQSSVKGASLNVLAAIPQNNLGVRQEKLTQLRDEFEDAMKLLGLIDDINDISKNTTVESYISYMKNQNDDFSIPEEEIWAAMNQDGCKTFNQVFSSKEEILDRMRTMGVMK